jgi:hypothetical protein
LLKYSKMKALNLPEGAIRQKMASEGLSEDLKTLFFSGGGVSSAASRPSPPGPPRPVSVSSLKGPPPPPGSPGPPPRPPA